MAEMQTEDKEGGWGKKRLNSSYITQLNQPGQEDAHRLTVKLMFLN